MNAVPQRYTLEAVPQMAGGSWLDHPFTLTTFKDFAASSKHEEKWTLRTLAERIRATTAGTKGALPWLKMAKFGDIRSDKDSLRCDSNVLAISGIEGDYDGEQVSVADAVESLEKAGMLAMVYTSPSHTEDAPRWRVLCPTSEEMPPADRAKLMGRLNGLFKGAFSGESWTLSQSYYYGSVNGNPSHLVELIDGTPIDQHDDLDAIWLAKPATSTKVLPTGERVAGTVDEAALLADITNGANYHDSSIRLLGRWARDGMAYMDARQRLLDAFDGVFPADRDARWQSRRADVDRSLDWVYGREARARDEGLRRPEPPPHPGYDGPDGDEGEPAPDPRQPAPDEESATALRTLLSVESWAVRDIPEPDRLLGDLLTTTTRVFLVGRTGLGKTLLGLAIASGVASGAGFLHWPSARPARVLYLDGEMPAELIKPRACDAIRRLGSATIPPGNLLIFGRDIEQEVRRLCPSLPPFAPLNTEDGRKFLTGVLSAIGGADLVVFDNVMSLIAGDQKDEVPWSDTLPLVSALTARRVGQLWLDHTGHNSDRQYGSSTKAWRFDAVGCMAPLSEEEADPRSTGFTLSFDHPGKARRRTPGNWREFEPQTIRLVDDQWTAIPVARRADHGSKLRPVARAQFDALLTAAAGSPQPGKTTRAAWYAECVRVGLARPVPPDANGKDRDQIEKPFRARMSDLKVAGWIWVDGETVTALRGPR